MEQKNTFAIPFVNLTYFIWSYSIPAKKRDISEEYRTFLRGTDPFFIISFNL